MHFIGSPCTSDYKCRKIDIGNNVIFHIPDGTWLLDCLYYPYVNVTTMLVSEPIDIESMIRIQFKIIGFNEIIKFSDDLVLFKTITYYSPNFECEKIKGNLFYKVLKESEEK